MTPAWLRTLALAIAVAGIIDPPITAVQRVKPEIALVGSPSLPDTALIDRVARSLDGRFTVIRGGSIAAAATVSVGYQLPGPADRHAPIGFAVLPEPRDPFVAITAIDAPPRVNLHAQAPISVRLQTAAARGRTLTLTLSDGNVTLNRIATTVTGDETNETLDVPVVPTATGISRYIVTAALSGGAREARADLALRVGDTRWAVLFFDARPSWMSTFVRRTAESDPRFVVSSRVSTSRGAAATAGRPPSALTSPPSLELFHAVLVGAPDLLGDSDVSGLEAFMRERGGTVVLLMDARSEGRPFERLTGVTRWNYANRAEAAGAPFASEFQWPVVMPSWATPLPGPGAAATSGGAAPPPAMWSMAVGRGRVVVSGALDAWRYRDRDSDSFDRFWRLTIASAAAAAPEANADELQDAAATAHQPTPDERDLIRAWASSRGGDAIPESALLSLGPALENRIGRPAERRPVHPMWSAWWILPFAIALSGEWWLRRRQGRR